MRFAALVLSLLLCATATVAKDVKVRIAWTRTFPNSSLGIMPDNVGNIAAVGTETNDAKIILLDRHGRRIASALSPIPGLASAVADKSGRFFLTGNESASSNVYCAAFSQSLGNLLWIEQKNLSNGYSPPTSVAGIGRMVADDKGGAYVFGNWGADFNFRYGFFFSEFRGDNSGLKSTWNPRGYSYDRRPVAAIKSRSGQICFITSSFSYHFPFITIQKYTPATHELIMYGSQSPQGYEGFSLPTAAACDNDGNLIIVGWYSDDMRGDWRLGTYFTLKMDSQLHIVWRARYGPLGGLITDWTSVARAMAITRNNDIVVSGGRGTVKYTSDGQLLWEAPESGDLLLDRPGNILLSKSLGEIIELNPNGTLRWQMRFDNLGLYSNWLTGLMTDDLESVYFSAVDTEQTTIVKLVEHDHDDDN